MGFIDKCLFNFIKNNNSIDIKFFCRRFMKIYIILFIVEEIENINKFNN